MIPGLPIIIRRRIGPWIILLFDRLDRHPNPLRVHVLPELDTPERRRIPTLAPESERRSREQLEVATGGMPPFADVTMAVHHERRAHLGENFDEALSVVEPHPDFGGRAPTDAVRQWNHMVVK